MVTIDAAGATDQGRVRARNEDAYLVGASVFAVADGLGGHPAGDVASVTALQPLQRLDERLQAHGDLDAASQVHTALVAAVEAAHDEVRSAAGEDPSRAGMGTTLTAVALAGEDILVAHVGDSRSYLLRDGALRQLSVDHTPVQLEIDAGRLDPAAARHHPARHVLAQAVGLDDGIQVDTRGTTRVQPGDRVLLCSDGLTEMVADDDIAGLLGGDDDAAALARRLVDAAVDAGGVDNVTTVVLRVEG